MAQKDNTSLLPTEHGLTDGVEQMTATCSCRALDHKRIDFSGMCDHVVRPACGLAVAFQHDPLAEGVLLRPAQAPGPSLWEG